VSIIKKKRDWKDKNISQLNRQMKKRIKIKKKKKIKKRIAKRMEKWLTNQREVKDLKIQMTNRLV